LLTGGGKMVYPEMIIFDYGHTLLYEPGFDTLRGEKALLKYVKSCRKTYTAEEINGFAKTIFREISTVRSMGYELHEWQFRKYLYEYLGIEFSIPMPEAERIFWYHTSPGEIMPGADKMIDYINSCGIRSGVVSNISFSGEALAERINRLLPNNRFEFIIASSEYMFRKPSRFLFELSLKKAGIDASKVWFCGDNPLADIEGAASAGMFPVWYENLEIDNLWCRNMKTPDCEHLHIHDWNQLIEVLERLRSGDSD